MLILPLVQNFLFNNCSLVNMHGLIDCFLLQFTVECKGIVIYLEVHQFHTLHEGCQLNK